MSWWPKGLTIFTCHHQRRHRVVSSCGWVESCRACRAVRWTESHGVAAGFWPPESRREVRLDGRCRGFDDADRLMYDRPIGSSVY